MFSKKFTGMALAAIMASTLVMATGCGAKEEATTDTAAQTTKSQTQVATLTEDDAKAAALKHAKVKEADATFTKVALETDDGVQKYDIAFTAGDTSYDYDIDAATGDVLSYEQETTTATATTTDQAQTTTQTQSTDQGNYIGEDAALNKALEHAGIAATDITSREIELDQDEVPLHYDVDFKVGQMEYSYEIDATTGDVLHFESEVDD